MMSPTFVPTCEHYARWYRDLGREAYAEGDERRGDWCAARALAWEMIAQDDALVVVPTYVTSRTGSTGPGPKGIVL